MSLMMPAYWIAAGIALFATVQSAIVASHGHRRKLYLSSAFVCFCVAGVLGSTASFYMSRSVDGAVLSLQWQLTFVFLVMPHLYTFIALYTGLKRPPALPAVMTFFMACMVINFRMPYTIRFSSMQALPPARLPWGEVVGNFRGVMSPWAFIPYAAVAVINLWSFSRALALYRRGEKRTSILFACFLTLQAASILGSFLIDRGVVQRFYTGGFPFIIIVLLMSFRLGVDIRDRNRGARRAAADWQETFDRVRSPIVLVDASGAVLRANRAACELAQSKDITALPDAEPWLSARDFMTRIPADGVASAELRDANGHSWEVTISRFSSVTEGEARCVIALWDITKLVELQESLRKRERTSAMGTLLGGVAHEVRNPLFGISATLDAYAIELGNPELSEFADALRAEVQRLIRLMQDLLEFGKPVELKKAPAQLDVVVAEAMSTFAGKDVNVVNLVPEALPPLMIDRARVRQVFENLIGNAIQHSPCGADVEVRGGILEQAGRTWIECSVDDSGPGFIPEDLERVFEPFYSRREGGTGLGLSIVQRVVEDHAGKVWVTNRLGGGASVRVRLPIAHV